MFWPWKYEHWNLKNVDLRNLSRNIYIFPAETCKNMGLFKVIVWLQMFRCPKEFLVGEHFFYFSKFLNTFLLFLQPWLWFFFFQMVFQYFIRKWYRELLLIFLISNKHFIKNQQEYGLMSNTLRIYSFLKCFWNMPWELGLGLKCIKSCSPDLVFFGRGNMSIEIWKMWI